MRRNAFMQTLIQLLYKV